MRTPRMRGLHEDEGMNGQRNTTHFVGNGQGAAAALCGAAGVCQRGQAAFANGNGGGFGRGTGNNNAAGPAAANGPNPFGVGPPVF